MKKSKLFIMASVLWGICFPATTLAQNINALVENARYYIEGQYSAKSVKDKSGKSVFQYRLTDITTKNIDFEGSRDLQIGQWTNEYCKFTFEKATTTRPEKFDGGLKFFRWDNNLNQWIPDSEVKDGQQGVDENKIATIMLTLDCSSSLGSDFDKLKEAAKTFIDIIYSEMTKGNIRIGIIGFNTMTNADKMVFPIEKLTESSHDRMLSFIDDLGIANNTAYYYALRKGSDMLDNYYRRISSDMTDAQNYAGSYIVSFTDGYDNQSIDPELGDPDEGINNPYFKFVRDSIINNHHIGGKKVESFVISLMGKDVEVGKDKFEGILRDLASNDDQYYNVENIRELTNTFRKIAKNLVNRWSNLSCYVPPAGKGRVRWIMDDEAKQPSATKTRSGYFCGYVEQMNIFNLNGGALYSTGGNLSFGKEWNDRLYVGAGISLYYMTDYYYDYSYWLGREYREYSSFSMDFFADIKYKFLRGTKVTSVAGLKLGAGFCDDELNIVTRPSLGVLFRLKGHHELMLNVEYVPAELYYLNGVSLNVGYKFGK